MESADITSSKHTVVCKKQKTTIWNKKNYCCPRYCPTPHHKQIFY